MTDSLTSLAVEVSASTVSAGDVLYVVGSFAVYVAASDTRTMAGGRYVTVTSATVKSSGLVELTAEDWNGSGRREMFLVYSDDTVVVERTVAW